MSLPVFLADGQAVVQNGLKPWSEKSLVAPVPYRCGAQVENLATNGGGHGGPPHHLSGGTGFQPVQDAGAPTWRAGRPPHELFRFYGWAKGP